MPKLTAHQLRLLAECYDYSVSEQRLCSGRMVYYRLGGSGYVPVRYNRHTLPKLRELGLVEYHGYYRASQKGRQFLFEKGLTA
jgi:hypothetical protein